MLALVVHAGPERYAFDVRGVREVVPTVALRPIAHAPREVAGLMVWRGRVVPVIDLVQLVAGRPCAPRMSSRVVVVDYPDRGGRRPLGILGEQVTEVERFSADRTAPGLTVVGAPYLGPLVVRTTAGAATGPAALTQIIDVAALLSPAVRALLDGAVAAGEAG
jgi:chemotaxis-related protein WspB